MNDYISLRIDVDPCSEDACDLLAAFLADMGYESFVSDHTGLTAYIKAEDFSQPEIEAMIADFPFEACLKASHEVVEGKDWNEEWEKNYFQPIVIDDQCVVHSTFHHDFPAARYEIVIDPKMAFGTGHHATTSMMLRHLLSMDLQGRDVIDMGTGTGILAILASKRGAHRVTGIEIDPGAHENALENVGLNNVDVTMLLGDSARLSDAGKAQIFIANINRNVILADLRLYAEALQPDGVMILSGFYEEDIPLIERAAALYGLQREATMTMQDPNLTSDDPALSHGPWASVRLRKARES
jgi:ribosomal protein L11 methyltransferase